MEESSLEKLPNRLLNLSFTQSLKSLSQGVWLENVNRIKLEKIRGKFIHHMGYLSDLHGIRPNGDAPTKYDFLYPEEALFLVENSNLIVHLNMRESSLKVLMSVQQCYELLFGQPADRFLNDTKNDPSQFNIDLNCFKIYSNLVKNGFIVRRAKPKDDQSSKNESKSKENRKSVSSRPLVNRSEHERLSQFEIYKRLEPLVQNVSLDELRDRLNQRIYSRNEHVFDVNQADKRFQKSKPPKSEFCIFAPRQQQSAAASSKMIVPGIDDFIANSHVTKTQIYSFTDDANHPIFYSFDFNFSIPSIVKE